MPLTIGSISVDENGNATGSGLALAIFEGALSGVDDADRASVAEGMVLFCTGIAGAIVNHIKDNAEITVVINPTDGGLQRTPNPNLADTDTQGPLTPKTFTGTIV